MGEFKPISVKTKIRIDSKLYFAVCDYCSRICEFVKAKFTCMDTFIHTSVHWNIIMLRVTPNRLDRTHLIHELHILMLVMMNIILGVSFDHLIDFLINMNIKSLFWAAKLISHIISISFCIVMLFILQFIFTLHFFPASNDVFAFISLHLHMLNYIAVASYEYPSAIAQISRGSDISDASKSIEKSIWQCHCYFGLKSRSSIYVDTSRFRVDLFKICSFR